VARPGQCRPHPGKIEGESLGEFLCVSAGGKYVSGERTMATPPRVAKHDQVATQRARRVRQAAAPFLPLVISK